MNSEKIHAIIAIRDGKEDGIMGMMGPNGWTPFVFLQERLLEMSISRAQQVKRATGVDFKVCVYQRIKEIPSGEAGG